MTRSATSRATKTETTRTTKTRERRVAEIMAFADTSRMARKYEPGWFEKVETELDEKLAELGRDLKAEIMAAHDIDAEAIEIDGVTHRVLRASQTYVTTAGLVVVEVALPRARRRRREEREPDGTASRYRR